jgi:DNA-binding transcriptional ArsR family regulator
MYLLPVDSAIAVVMQSSEQSRLCCRWWVGRAPLPCPTVFAFSGARLCRVGMSPATAYTDLKALTGAGLLERRPYQEEGERVRQEFVLTDAGTDLMPVVIDDIRWSRSQPDRATLTVNSRTVNQDGAERQHSTMKLLAWARPQ